MDVVDARADLAGVSVGGEGLEHGVAAAGVLDGDDIRVHAVDGVEDVLELGVAHVGVDLGGGGRLGGGEAEGVDGPAEVLGSAGAFEGESFAEGGLVDLDGLGARGLEVGDFVPQAEGDLAGDEAARDVRAAVGPVEDGDGACEHGLDGLVGERLGEAELADGHGRRPADVGVDDGRADAAAAEALDPAVEGEGEAAEALAEELDHVGTLELAVDEHVEAEPFLDADAVADEEVDAAFVFLGGDVALEESGAEAAEFGGLGEGTDGGGGQGRQSDLEVAAFGVGQGAAEVVGAEVVEAAADLGVGRREGFEGAPRGGVGQAVLAEVAQFEEFLLGEGEDGAEGFGEMGFGRGGVGDELEGAGGGEAEGGDEVAEFLEEGLDGLGPEAPDVAAVDDACGEGLVLGPGVLAEEAEGVAAGEVECEDGGGEGDDPRMVFAEVVEEGDEVDGDADGGQAAVGGFDGWAEVGEAFEDEGGFVELDFGEGHGFEVLEEFEVGGEDEVEEAVRREGGLGEEAVGEGAEEGGDGAVAEGLAAVEEEVEEVGPVGLGPHGVGDFGNDVVVVGVEPFGHVEGGEVLGAAGHGEMAFESLERAEARWDEAEAEGPVEDGVVEGFQADGDEVDACVGLDAPSAFAEDAEGFSEGGVIGLAVPEGLEGGLEFAVGADAGVSEGLGGEGHGDPPG